MLTHDCSKQHHRNEGEDVGEGGEKGGVQVSDVGKDVRDQGAGVCDLVMHDGENDLQAGANPGGNDLHAHGFQDNEIRSEDAGGKGDLDETAGAETMEEREYDESSVEVPLLGHAFAVDFPKDCNPRLTGCRDQLLSDLYFDFCLGCGPSDTISFTIFIQADRFYASFYTYFICVWVW